MRKFVFYIPTLIIALAGFVFLMSDSSFWQSTAIAAQEHDEGASKAEESGGAAAKKMSFAKDLQVLEFNNMLELQTYMKTLTESLGVQCTYCHDVKDFAKTVPDLHKDEGREMMKLVKQLNGTFFKDADDQVTCFTCHRGHPHPANTKAVWEKQMSEKASK